MGSSILRSFSYIGLPLFGSLSFIQTISIQLILNYKFLFRHPFEGGLTIADIKLRIQRFVFIHILSCFYSCFHPCVINLKRDGPKGIRPLFKAYEVFSRTKEFPEILKGFSLRQYDFLKNI